MANRTNNIPPPSNNGHGEPNAASTEQKSVAFPDGIPQEVLDAVEKTKRNPTDYGRRPRVATPSNTQHTNLVGGCSDEVEIGTAEDDAIDVGEYQTAATKSAEIGRVKFLISDGWLPYGMLTTLFGEPGMSKSIGVLLAFARPVLVGNHTRWFNGTVGPAKPGNVIWVDTEGSTAITVDRARKAGLPLERLILFTGSDKNRLIDLANPDDTALLKSYALKFHAPLIVLDSLRGSHRFDENNSAGITGVLQSAACIAEETGTAFLAIHHAKKMYKDEQISANSSRGSNTIQAMSRVQIALDRPNPESNWVRMQVTKSNVSQPPAPVGFLYENDQLTFGEPPLPPKRGTAKQACQDLLCESMRVGQWYATSKIDALATKRGFSVKTIRQAKESLGITFNQGNVRKEGGEWVCRISTCPST